jgi:hypothetical protein
MKEVRSLWQRESATELADYYGLRKSLVERFGTAGEALYTFLVCLLVLAVSGLAAYLFKRPFLFPSPAPTAFLFVVAPNQFSGLASGRLGEPFGRPRRPDWSRTAHGPRWASSHVRVRLGC